MAVRFSFDERKWLPKLLLESGDAVNIERCWRVEFGTPTPTTLTITRIRDWFDLMERFEKFGAVEREAALTTGLMPSCRFVHDPQSSQ